MPTVSRNTPIVSTFLPGPLRDKPSFWGCVTQITHAPALWGRCVRDMLAEQSRCSASFAFFHIQDFQAVLLFENILDSIHFPTGIDDIDGFALAGHEIVN